MQIRFKTLLASSLLVLMASNSTAEQAMGFGSQGPIWGGNGPAPIAWGDCIPVPVAPNNMMPFNGAPMGNMMGEDFAPFPMQGGNMIPMPQGMAPSYDMPPPSPFFGTAPAMPSAAPLPIMPPPQAVVCDDGSQQELHALQNRYNQAAAASKAKIEEITLTMQDAHNQMADARIIIEKLSKQQEADQAKITTLESKSKGDKENLGKVLSYADDLAKLKQDHAAVSTENAELKSRFTKMDNAYRFMESKLAKLKSQQTIGAVTNINSGQSKNIIQALNANVASLENENEKLKVTFTKMDNAYRFMESKLAKLTSQQTMNAVTNINNDQSKNIIDALKAKITSLGDTNKTLQSQLGTLQNDAGAQARKLTALGQSATELTALKSAYQSRNDENSTLKKELAKLKSEQTASTLSGAQNKNIIEALKAKIASLDDNNKTLQAQLGTLQSNTGAQARKLTALGQSATELAALKSAYKSKNTDNEALMLKLIELNNANKSLQSQIGTYKMEVGSQARKLTALSQSATELSAIQSAYKARNNENAELKNKVAALADSNKTLQSQLGMLQNSAGAQSRKLTALGQSATELTALRSAYQERNNENAELKAKLSKLVSLQTSTVLKSAQNKNIIDDLKKKLAVSDDQGKTCIAKTATLETTSSNQARKITALSSKTAECVALKSAYDALNATKADLNTQLTAATADDDSDGILNSLDKCPTSPAGSKVNAKGCPDIKDTDSDGVADANDLCLNTTAGTTVNEFGCTSTDHITLKGVTFNLGSATLRSSSFPVLDAAAETLKKAPDLKVQVSGYTDYQGSAATNKRLSQRRANSVMIHLIKKGVNAANLSAIGYGEKNPIATNETAEGRATNRRVELKIK